MSELAELLRLKPGQVNLAEIEASATPGFSGDKTEAEKALADLGAELAELQEKLFAAAYTGGNRNLLLVLQGMDTSGKGGILTHTIGLLDPVSVRLTSFKKPTPAELAHDFLWRIENALPAAGQIGVFDRSHYEDVLVVRVHQLAEPAEIERRYSAINDFEAKIAQAGTTIIKVMLHIDLATQKQRLLDRLADPSKQWKFKPGDLDERALWADYQSAYQIALENCNSEVAPWYVVPSGKKWYRNWAIGQLLVEKLRELELSWPTPNYDVMAQQTRLNSESLPG